MIIEKALELVTERQEAYGDIYSSFNDVAKAFNAITGKSLSDQDVVLIQVLLKLKRAQGSPDNMDHFVDVAGYTEILARLNVR